MASTKLAFLVVAILLLKALLCAQSQQGGTAARMVLASFQPGHDWGSSVACDGKYHSNGDLVAALPTQWYEGGSRCNKQISITWLWRNAVAEVVGEYYCSGCKDNIVATSKAVWDKLGLDIGAGEVDITWADA